MNINSYRRKYLMKNISVLYVVLVLILFLPSITDAGWLMFHKPAFKGKVIDAETKEPIEGAVVVAIYYEQPIISGPGGGSSSIINVKESLTDKEGEFNITSYTTVIQPNSLEDYTEFIIYKPGYGSQTGYNIFPLQDIQIKLEEYFSEDFGVKKEIEKSDGNYVSVAFGVIELPSLKTKEERLKAMPGRPTDYRSTELPLLYKAMNEENKRFGLGEER